MSVTCAPGALRPGAQSGAGFVEVLCAVVILSIGMLASTAMQLAAMQTNQSALHRGNALFLAEDMVSRMRANRQGIEAGAYANIDTAQQADGAAGAAGEPVPDCLVAGCSAAALAAADIAAWAADLQIDALRLPARANGSAARGTVVRGADGVYTVRLEWSTSAAGELTDDALTLKVNP